MERTLLLNLDEPVGHLGLGAFVNRAHSLPRDHCRQLRSDNAVYAANNELMGDNGGDPSRRRESPNSVRGGRMRHGTGTVKDRRASCASVMWDTSPLPTLAADTLRHRQHFLRRQHYLDEAEAAHASGGSSLLPRLPRTFKQTIGKRRERRRSTEFTVDVCPQRFLSAEQPYNEALFEKRRRASLAAISIPESTLAEVCTGTFRALHMRMSLSV